MTVTGDGLPPGQCGLQSEGARQFSGLQEEFLFTCIFIFKKVIKLCYYLILR